MWGEDGGWGGEGRGVKWMGIYEPVVLSLPLQCSWPLSNMYEVFCDALGPNFVTANVFRDPVCG